MYKSRSLSIGVMRMKSLWRKSWSFLVVWRMAIPKMSPLPPRTRRFGFGSMRITHHGRALDYHVITARPMKAATVLTVHPARRPVTPARDHPWRRRLRPAREPRTVAAST